MRASQDKNREQGSLLAVVCIIIMNIPLILIYQEESGDLQDSQIKDVSDNTIYFAATPSRQNNNNIKRQQIKKMFNKYIKKKLGKDINC